MHPIDEVIFDSSYCSQWVDCNYMGYIAKVVLSGFHKRRHM